MSAKIHPDWQATDEGAQVSVHEAPKRETSASAASPMGRRISRRPAAIAGILLVAGIGLALHQYSSRSATDDATPQPATPLAAQATYLDLLRGQMEEAQPAADVPATRSPVTAGTRLSPSIPRNPNTATPGQTTPSQPLQETWTSIPTNPASVTNAENVHSGAPLLGKGKGKPGKQPSTGAGTLAMAGITSLAGILWMTRKMFAEAI